MDIKANLTSRGGLIQAGNVLYQPSFLAVRLEDSALAPAANQQARLRRGRRDAGRARRLGQSAAGRRRPGRPAGARRRRIALRGTGDVAVDAGSVLDVTAGASLLSDGKLQGGKGGNVTLASHVLGQIPSNGGLLSFAGEVRGYGVTGGGTLSVASGGKIVLGGPVDAQDVTTLRLDPLLFSTGFGKYEINGYKGLTVADGAQIDVHMPVLRLEGGAAQAPGSGAPPADVLTRWTPALYTEDALRGTLTQRAGADLALYSDRAAQGGPIVGEGARQRRSRPLDPDPWRGPDHRAGPSRCLGRPHFHPGAARGRAALCPGQSPFGLDRRAGGAGHRRPQPCGDRRQGPALWHGAGRRRHRDRRHAELGGRCRYAHPSHRPPRHPASRLAAGRVRHAGRWTCRDAARRWSARTAAASCWPRPTTCTWTARCARRPVRQAAGGTLGIAFGGAFYQRNLSPEQAVLQERRLVLTQRQGESRLAAGLRPGQASAELVYGTGRLGVDRVEAGGFDNLALDASVFADGNVTLAMRQSLRLSGC